MHSLTASQPLDHGYEVFLHVRTTVVLGNRPEGVHSFVPHHCLLNSSQALQGRLREKKM